MKFTSESTCPADMPSYNMRLDWVRPSELRVDPSYQRDLIHNDVERISSSFCTLFVGALVVFEREDGTLVVADGQHRFTGALQSGYEDPLPALIITGLNQRWEAYTFDILNRKRRPVHAVDRAKAQLTAQHANSLVIDKVLNSLNLRFCKGQVVGGIQAVASVEKVYNKFGEDVLFMTLSMMKNSFDVCHYQGSVVEAIGCLIAENSTTMDFKRFVDLCLSPYESDRALLSKAQGRGQNGDTARGLVIAYVGTAYNKKLRDEGKKIQYNGKIIGQR